METVLDRARNSELTINPAGIDVILESADYLRRWLVHLEASLHQEAVGGTGARRGAAGQDHAAEFGTGAAESAGLASLAAAVSIRGSSGAGRLPKPARLAWRPAKQRARTARQPRPHLLPAAASETMAVKVDTAKLDYLVDMAGEMVIAESLVRHDPELAALKSPRCSASWRS